MRSLNDEQHSYKLGLSQSGLVGAALMVRRIQLIIPVAGVQQGGNLDRLYQQTDERYCALVPGVIIIERMYSDSEANAMCP